MTSIHAIFENGVFRPIGQIDLPERCEVEIQIGAVVTEQQRPTLDDVYEILGRRYSSGEHDVAARHNEHQP